MIHLPTYFDMYANDDFEGFEFYDLTTATVQNPIYIDYFRFIPYSFQRPNRQLYIYDACGVLSTVFVPLANICMYGCIYFILFYFNIYIF